MAGIANTLLFSAIVVTLGGYGVAVDWGAAHHREPRSAGEYVDTALAALKDTSYMNALSGRIGAAIRGQRTNEVPAPGGRAQLVSESNTPALEDGGNWQSGLKFADDSMPAVWDVGYEIDENNPISGNKVLVADLLHRNHSGGGQIEARATCGGGGTIQLEFSAFDASQRGAAFDYATSDRQPMLIILYRMDGGDMLMATDMLSSTGYINVAQVAFSTVGPDYEPVSLNKLQGSGQQDGPDSNSFGKAFADALVFTMQATTSMVSALTPRDIKPFVRSRNVQFQLPLQGGVKEIIEFSPQEASFRSFVSQCHIAT